MTRHIPEIFCTVQDTQHPVYTLNHAVNLCPQLNTVLFRPFWHLQGFPLTHLHVPAFVLCVAVILTADCIPVTLQPVCVYKFCMILLNTRRYGVLLTQYILKKMCSFHSMLLTRMYLIRRILTRMFLTPYNRNDVFS